MTIDWKPITDGCEAYNGERWLLARRPCGNTLASCGTFFSGFFRWMYQGQPTHYAELTPIPEPESELKISNDEARKLFSTMLKQMGFSIAMDLMESESAKLTPEQITQAIKEAMND